MSRTNSEILAALAVELVHVTDLHKVGSITADEWIGRDLSIRQVARALGLSSRALRHAEQDRVNACRL